MADERRIRQLLEQLMDSDGTPEQVCHDHPDLLVEVRERWRQVRTLESQLEALFPTPRPIDADAGGAPTPRRSIFSLGAPESLPEIPGYELEAELGRGGMGVVYRARHLALKRPVAIKMVLAGAFASPGEVACLVREAEAVAGVRHPHIVQVHDVGEAGGLPFFTMEYVEGGTLAKRLAGVPQPPREAAALVATLAGAVHAAHQGGIVHRDLKPANILLAADGTPKIADFSLARSFAGDSALTLSSARVGTPSYMAPEQAMGKAAAFCPAVDIYALGALLYEMLTGRPPFRAETPAQTQRQVISEEPALPSRLNPGIPRDLETICLKCLSKDPERRYPTALALGDDLRRFLLGEPVTARPAGRAERLAKWLRRHPAQATAIAATGLALMTLVAGATWAGTVRARISRAANEDLQEVRLRQASADWSAARTALERAKARLGDGGPASLRQRVADAQLDLEMVTRLDQVRLARAAVVEGRVDRRANNAAADAAYTSAFRDARLADGPDEDPHAVAERIRASDIRAALVTALDDWVACNIADKNHPRRDWLLEVARLADPDPAGWRDRVRTPDAWDDKARLLQLADSMPDSERSISLLLAMGEALEDRGADAAAFLSRVQHASPSDFWVNINLGRTIGMANPGEATRYLQAAAALRPDAAVAYATLGTALGMSGRFEEAGVELRRALQLDPSLALAHNSLGNVLLETGRRDEAMDEFRLAIAHSPRFSSAYSNLGKALVEAGRTDEAMQEFRTAIEIDPDFAAARSSLGLTLTKLGRHDEAIEQCEAALASEPDSIPAHINISLALKEKGRVDEAMEHLRRAIVLGPGDAEPYYNLARCLAVVGRTAEAEAEYRRSIRLRPCYARAHHGLGILLGDAGDLDGAIACFLEALRCDPNDALSAGALGRALMAQGRFAEARPPLQTYLDSLSESDQRRPFIARFIRQCEQMIGLEARLDAIVRGDDHPADAQETLTLAELCKFKKRYADAAGFFADAFALSPALAGDLRARHRYDAACVACLASGEATTADPARWRERARGWLRDDLATWTRALESTDPRVGDVVLRALMQWQIDPDLQGIRDEPALAGLPEAELKECRALWADVQSLLFRVQNR